MTRARVLWITQTAVFVAILVCIQVFTGPLGQFVTGSMVNFTLVAACVLIGLPAAAIVGVLSPFIAFLITGRTIFPVLIPFVMVGNVALVAAVSFISVKSFVNLNIVAYARIGAAIIVGSVLKFLILWVGVVHVALPFLIPGILPPQVTNLSAMFSWPQLVTALIGSTLAMIIMPNLMRALKITRACSH